jgi:ActR/RegA family two-component response regulator
VAVRILVVDDEIGIRMTLPVILERHGFQVATAGSVAEALERINHQEFDVLLSDLNIGEPGDGFTVVSAMRRVQPEACTFILTGYPDFETALQAIRSQVDDYLIKPADVPELVSAIERKLHGRKPKMRPAPLKRVSELLRENVDRIVEEWLKDVKGHPELASVEISDKQRIDHLPHLIAELADRLDEHPSQSSKEAKDLAKRHGEKRAAQGYSIPQVLTEFRLLQHVLSATLQRNLIRIDLSTVIADMLEVGEGLHEELDYSVRSFQEHSTQRVA